MPGEEREIIIITYFLLQFSLFVITVKTAQNMTKKTRFNCYCLQRGLLYRDIDIYYLKIPVTFYM